MGSSAIERRLRGFFRDRSEGLAAVYLFGSQARGTAGSQSDVDVAALFSEDPRPTLDGAPLSLEGELERLLRTEVQLVVLNRAPVDLIHRVLRDGTLLLDADPSARIRFEVKSRNEYFDLLPYLRQYRKLEPAGR